MLTEWVVRCKDSVNPVILGATQVDPTRDTLLQVAGDINRDYPFLALLKYEVRLERWVQKAHVCGLYCPQCQERLAPPKAAKNLLWPVSCFNCDTSLTLPEKERGKE